MREQTVRGGGSENSAAFFTHVGGCVSVGAISEIIKALESAGSQLGPISVIHCSWELLCTLVSSAVN